MAFKVVAVLFLSIGALLDFALCDCNSTVIYQCISEIEHNFNLISFLERTTNLTAFSATCSQLASASACLKTKTTCDSADTNLQDWNSLYSPLSYLCSDGNAGFVQFQTCFTNSNYSQDLRACLEKMPAAELFFGSKIPNFAAYCKYVNTQFACYFNAAQSDCNSGDFVTNYYKKSRQENIDLFGCTLEPKDQVSTNRCNYTKLFQCSYILIGQPLLNPGDKGYNPFAPFSQPFNANQLSDICNALNSATSCIASISGCDSSDINGNYEWISASNVWSYICKDGQAGMTQFQKCFLSTSTYANRSAVCAAQLASGSQTPTGICQNYKSTLLCGALAAKDGCDSEQFAANAFVKSLNPVLGLRTNSNNCVLSYNAPPTGTMSMVTRSNGITLAAILLSMYLGHNY